MCDGSFLLALLLSNFVFAFAEVPSFAGHEVGWSTPKDVQRHVSGVSVDQYGSVAQLRELPLAAPRARSQPVTPASLIRSVHGQQSGSLEQPTPAPSQSRVYARKEAFPKTPAPFPSQKRIAIFLASIAFIVGYWYFGINRNASLTGEDSTYLTMAAEIPAFHPVMISISKIGGGAADDSTTLESVAQGIGSRMQAFADENLPRSDCDKRWLPLEERGDNWIRTTDVFQASWHAASQTVIVAANHAVVGGGDFLNIGCTMFEGKSSQLVNLDGYWLITRWIARIRFLVFMACFIRYTPLDRCLPSEKVIITEVVDIPSLPSLQLTSLDSRQKKTHYLFALLTNLSYAFPGRRKLQCWLPIGVKKTPTCNSYNNVGIICFAFCPGEDTVTTLDRKLNRNSYQVLGSHFHMSRVTGKAAHTGSRSVKAKVDVVLTLGHMKTSFNCLQDFQGVMASCMDLHGVYPVYVLGLTVNDKAFVTYNFGVPAPIFDQDAFLRKCPNAKPFLPDKAWARML